MVAETMWLTTIGLVDVSIDTVDAVVRLLGGPVEVVVADASTSPNVRESEPVMVVAV